MSELRELLDLPESVTKSAFVVRLSGGVCHPEAGDAYAAFVKSEARTLGVTFEQLRAWRPPEKREERAAARRAKAAPVQATLDMGDGGAGVAEAAPKKRGRRKKADGEPT